MMKSVRTMALSFVAAGAAAGGSLWAGYPTTGLAPLPEARYPIYRTAYEPTTVIPTDNGGPIMGEEESPNDSVMRYPGPYSSRGPASVAVEREYTNGGGACAGGGPGYATGGGYASGGSYVSGDYADAMDSSWVGEADCGVPAGCGPWYASASALIMTRDSANKFWTTYEDGNNPNQLMNTSDAESGWGAGFETRIGRCCSSGCAFEGVYWGVFGLDGDASVSHPSGVSTPIDVGGVNIGAFPAQNYFGASPLHTLHREGEVHNVEVNWIFNPLGCCSCGCPCDCDPCGDACGGGHGGILGHHGHGRHGGYGHHGGGYSGYGASNGLNVSFLAGFRYFRFDEELIFGSTQFGQIPGDPAQTAYLDIDVVNNLVGFQLGSRADWVHCRWGFFAAPKVGVYANTIDATSQLYNGVGEYGFSVDGNKTDVAFLAQLDLGVDYYITECWKAFVGYRAVAVTGVALTDDQIPAFLVDYPAYADIDSAGSMILHGAFAGLECRF